MPDPGYLCLTQTRVQNFSSVPGNTSLDIGSGAIAIRVRSRNR